MYKRRMIRLCQNLRVLPTGCEGIIPNVCVIILRMGRIDCMRVVITSFSGSLKRGSLARTPGDLLASSIVTMGHVILIAHSDFLALITSQFQATTDIGCD